MNMFDRSIQKVLAVSAMLSLGVIMCSCSEESGLAPTIEHPKPTKGFFDPKRDSNKDLTDAKSTAKKGHKRILLDIGGDWAFWSKRLEPLLDSDRDISSVLAGKYVVVHVNSSQGSENKAFLSKLPTFDGFPHFFVLDASGKVLVSQGSNEFQQVDHIETTKLVEFLKKWAGP